MQVLRSRPPLQTGPIIPQFGATRTRPAFDLVTGVSSGALIAPFAFLGRDHDNQLRKIFTKYGRQDIFTYDIFT
jgi:hypothetical protein